MLFVLCKLATLRASEPASVSEEPVPKKASAASDRPSDKAAWRFAGRLLAILNRRDFMGSPSTPIQIPP